MNTQEKASGSSPIQKFGTFTFAQLREAFLNRARCVVLWKYNEHKMNLVMSHGLSFHHFHTMLPHVAHSRPPDPTNLKLAEIDVPVMQLMKSTNSERTLSIWVRSCSVNNGRLPLERHGNLIGLRLPQPCKEKCIEKKTDVSKHLDQTCSCYPVRVFPKLRIWARHAHQSLP